jgi:hypothetical protein
MKLNKNQKTVVAIATAVLILSLARLIPVRVEESTEIKVTRLADEVWTVINDVENYPTFWKKAPKAKQNKLKPFEFFLLDSQGQPSDRKYLVTKYERPTLLTLSIPPNLGSLLGETVWTFYLSESEGKTTLRIEEDGDLAGWLVTGIFTAIGFNTNLKDYARSLKNLMEPN